MNDGQASHLMLEDYRIPWIPIPAVLLRVKSLPSSKTHLLCKRGKSVSIPWDCCERRRLTHKVDVAYGGQNGVRVCSFRFLKTPYENSQSN